MRALFGSNPFTVTIIFKATVRLVETLVPGFGLLNTLLFSSRSAIIVTANTVCSYGIKTIYHDFTESQKSIS